MMLNVLREGKLLPVGGGAAGSSFQGEGGVDWAGWDIFGFSYGERC